MGNDARRPELTIPPGTKNDTGLSVEEVMRRLAVDSVDVRYGELMIRLEGSMIREAVELVAKETPASRLSLRYKVTKALDRVAPKILKGRATKQECDESAADLALLHALNAYRA